jgi:hypothetical protein
MYGTARHIRLTNRLVEASLSGSFLDPEFIKVSDDTLIEAAKSAIAEVGRRADQFYRIAKHHRHAAHHLRALLEGREVMRVAEQLAEQLADEPELPLHNGANGHAAHIAEVLP